MNLDAAGPEQIRTAIGDAIQTTQEHSEETGSVAAILSAAADRYASLQIAASTVAHLRDAAGHAKTAEVALAGAGEELAAALADFDARDGQVADTVADAGNLASSELLTGGQRTAAGENATAASKAASPASPVYQVIMFAGSPFGTYCWVALDECLDQYDVVHRTVWRVGMGSTTTNFWTDAEAAVNGGEPAEAYETVDPDWFFDGDTDWEHLALYSPDNPDEPRYLKRHLTGGLGERGTPVADGLELFYLRENPRV